MALKSPSERRTTIFLSYPVRVEHPSWSANSAAKSLTGPQTGNALSATLGLAMHGLWIWSHGIKPIYSRRVGGLPPTDFLLTDVGLASSKMVPMERAPT